MINSTLWLFISSLPSRVKSRRRKNNNAEGEGFEPPNRLSDCHVSSVVPSTSRPSFQFEPTPRTNEV